MKTYNITLLKGDGIGPEIVTQAVKVLDAVGNKFGFSVNYTEALIGGAAIDATGEPLPQATIYSRLSSAALPFFSICSLSHLY